MKALRISSNISTPLSPSTVNLKTRDRENGKATNINPATIKVHTVYVFNEVWLLQPQLNVLFVHSVLPIFVLEVLRKYICVV